jgi:hypothetical protein
MNCLYITWFFKIVAGIVQTILEPASISPNHRSLPPALWTTSWLLAPHHRRRTSFGEFTAPLRHILPIHNITINSKNLSVNFHWTFTFCVEKSYDGTHLAFGGTLDQHCHFKHVSLKQSRFYHSQRSTAQRQRIKVDGSVATIRIQNFPLCLHVM